MKKSLKIITGLIVVILVLVLMFGGGTDELVDKELQKIENQVATDAVKQYEIAKKNGSAMDAYVQAGIVAAAFLQANDEENYKKWKAIENDEAKNAGIK